MGCDGRLVGVVVAVEVITRQYAVATTSHRALQPPFHRVSVLCVYVPSGVIHAQETFFWMTVCLFVCVEWGLENI